MSTQKKSLKSKYAKMQKDNIYHLIPLCLVIGLVPLIIFIKEIIINDLGNQYWSGGAKSYDVFSYYKMVYLLIFTAAGFLLYLIMPKDDPFAKDKRIFYLPAGVFSLLALLSALTSEYRQVAYFGFLERYEGVFVLIAYFAIMFLAMNLLIDERSVKMLFGCLLISAAILSIIGLLQYIGIDIMRSDFFMKIITPAELQKLGGTMQLRTEEGMIFSTLYNPNYVGSYMAMLMPIIAVLIVWAKKAVHKLILTGLFLLEVINWIGCDSRAGLVGGLVAFLVLIVLFRKRILRYKWIALAIVGVLCCALVVFNFATNGSVVERIARMATLGAKIDDDAETRALNEALKGLGDVSMDNDTVELLTDKGIFRGTLTGNQIQFSDGENQPVSSRVDENIITFGDERFKNIKLKIVPDNGKLEIHYNEYHLLDMAMTGDGLVSITNRWMPYRQGREIEAFGFKGLETAGSNRGYIWSRTLPLLKNTILIGKGPDTFAIYFPQYDFLNKLRYYKTGGIFVDKAHNMYLQIALSTGVLSLLALLALFGIYAVSSIKTYWKEKFDGFLPMAGVACFTAFCGYVVAGLFNDSNVHVSPVFWVLMGLGIGINLKLAMDKKKAEMKESRPAGSKTAEGKTAGSKTAEGKTVGSKTAVSKGK